MLREGGRQGVADALGFADLSRAGEANAPGRARFQDRLIGRQFLRLHGAEAGASRARAAPGFKAPSRRLGRGPDDRVAGRADQIVRRFGQDRQPHPGAQRIIEKSRQDLGAVRGRRRARGRQESQRPRSPRRHVSRPEIQGTAESEQPAERAFQGRGRGHGFALLGGDVADVAEGGAASRIASVDQNRLETRRLKPESRRRSDQAAADDRPALRRPHAEAPSPKGSSRLCDGSVNQTGPPSVM